MVIRQHSKNSYQLLDSGGFRKLEQIGNVIVDRPCLQAFWPRRLEQCDWQKAGFRFDRDKSGKGKWKKNHGDFPKNWVIEHGGLCLEMRSTDFGHMGAFFEQGKNWPRITQGVSNLLADSPGSEVIHILNLFGYTGGSTLAASKGGAKVTHLDASKTSVQWAKDNARHNRLDNNPIRWVVDDAVKFLKREARRKSLYDGVILDPPSFGRGPKGEVWKLEDSINELLDNVRQVLKKNAGFVLLSGHSQGLTPIAIANLLGEHFRSSVGDKIFSEEMTVSEKGKGRSVPSGACGYVHGGCFDGIL